MTRQTPESKIALNPVVIDDSKRGLPPQNNISPDMGALLAWLKDQALEAHTIEKELELLRDGAVTKNDARRYDHLYGVYKREKEAYTRVIAKIENSRVNQRPHVPQGWDEVS